MSKLHPRIRGSFVVVGHLPLRWLFSDHIGRDLPICRRRLHPNCCDEVVNSGVVVTKENAQLLVPGQQVVCPVHMEIGAFQVTGGNLARSVPGATVCPSHM